MDSARAKPPHILYLSYDGLTDPLGQSQILPYLIGLSEMGYSFSVISFEKELAFQKQKELIQAKCTLNGIEWIPLRYHKKPAVFSTIYDLWHLWFQVKKVYRQNGFQIIHCRSYLTSLIGLRAKRKWGVKFVFDMRGFWADERVEGGLWNLKNPIFRSIYAFFKNKEKQFTKEADYIISLTENAQREILEWNLNSSVNVIPCCVDVDHFDPSKIDAQEKELIRDNLGINPGEFILLYLGSLGTWYLTGEMLIFFGELKKAIPNSKFLIVTPDYIDLSGNKDKRDIIVRQANRKDVPSFISIADASVIFIKPSFSKKASSATKMAEVLAMGKPVVVNTGWGDIDYFDKLLPGLVTVSSPENYTAVIESLPQQANAEQIRKGAIEIFSLVKGVALYSKVYDNLI